MTLSSVSLNHGVARVDLELTDAQESAVRDLARSFDTAEAGELNAIELHAAFMQHCVKRGDSSAALAVFDSFCQIYDTVANDVHVVVQARGLDEVAARRVLKGYFSAWSIVNGDRDSQARLIAPAPALFAAVDPARLMALFGGQRGSNSYLDEAAWLLDVYGPLLTDFVVHMSEFLHRESQNEQIASVYSKGLSVFQWLTVDGTMPGDSYILSSPVCMPLYGLTQLMHVMVLYKTLGVSPGELVKRFKGKLLLMSIVLSCALSLSSN
ncbi:beta subunit of fatty acid synthetase [Coemansia sp. RSA 2673]|nr:beta subunit of fatty acid synthetase [Coemansia sp. RSA 2673]